MSDSADPATLDYASPVPPARHVWIDPLVCGALFAAAVAVIAGWPASFAGADDRIAITGPLVAVAFAFAPLVGGAIARRALPPPGVPRAPTVADVALRFAAFVVFVTIPLIALLPALRPLTELPGAAQWSSQRLGRLVVDLLLVHLGLMVAFHLVGWRAGPTTVRLLLLGMAIAAAALIAMTGSIRIAQKTAALAAVLAVAVVVGALWRPARRMTVDVVLWASVVILTQLATARYWSEMKVWHAACVVVTPVVAAIVVGLPFVARRRPWVRTLIVVFVAAIPAIVACAIAGPEAVRALQSDGASDYGY